MYKYIELIKVKNPSLIVERYAFNNEGQNNDVVIINDEYLFKFPRYPVGIEKLKREANILDVINRYVDLDIPSPKYFYFDSSEVGQVYCGYKMIKGVPLRKEIFQNINEKGELAKQLATFLKQLHSIPLEEAIGIGVSAIDNRSHWASMFEKIREELFPFIKKESQESISANFNSLLNQSFSINKTLIHGDFGPTNIIYDFNYQRISGIIDFNEVSIGDPASDIASLIGPAGYSEEFIKSFESIYPITEMLLKRAKLYASTFALQEALFGMEFGDKKAFNAGMKDYL